MISRSRVFKRFFYQQVTGSMSSSCIRVYKSSCYPAWLTPTPCATRLDIIITSELSGCVAPCAGRLLGAVNFACLCALVVRYHPNQAPRRLCLRIPLAVVVVVSGATTYALFIKPVAKTQRPAHSTGSPHSPNGLVFSDGCCLWTQQLLQLPALLTLPRPPPTALLSLTTSERVSSCYTGLLAPQFCVVQELGTVVPGCP
jgi:hypothetical protein